MDGLNNNLAFESTARGKGSKVTKSSLVEGLDSSILIDPRRLHMTLGVMSLEQDDDSVEPPETTTPLGHLPKKTVSSALYLLNSLKPRISEILQSDKGIKVPLEVMHVFKTEKMRLNTKGNQGGGRDRKEGTSGRKQNETSEGGRRGDSGPSNVMPEKEAIGASVLYVAPEIKNQSVNADLRKLIQVSGPSHLLSALNVLLTDNFRLCPSVIQRRWLCYWDTTVKGVIIIIIICFYWHDIFKTHFIHSSIVRFSIRAIETLVLDNPSVILTFLCLMLFASFKMLVIQFLDLKKEPPLFLFLNMNWRTKKQGILLVLSSVTFLSPHFHQPYRQVPTLVPSCQMFL